MEKPYAGCEGLWLRVDKSGDLQSLWRSIAELDEKTRYGDENGFLLCAPELVDLDCNVHGVGMGYYQDERDVPSDENGAIREPGVDYGGWLACKWSMTNDEWSHVPCTPTHYIKLEGPIT